MRGYSAPPLNQDLLDPNAFLVLDRLYETLDVRIQHWKDDHKAASAGTGARRWGMLSSVFAAAVAPCLAGSSSNGNNNRQERRRTQQKMEHDVRLQRLIVAYDLAAAFSYMHTHR
jgi:hypothetical protein